MTDEQLMKESTEIAHGEATRQFLESDAGKAVMKRAEMAIYDEWIASKSPEQRELCWAKSEALLALALSMRATHDSGTVAKNNRGVREAKKKQQNA